MSIAEMIADPETDSEMRTLAEEEFKTLRHEVPKLDGQLKILLLLIS